VLSMGRQVAAIEGEVVSGSELLIISVISFLTRCRRSPGIWRLTGAAYLVISHGAIRRRTANTSAADCFCPLWSLCIVTLVSKNLWKVPWTVNLTGHLTLTGSPTGSEYRFSCEPRPPSSKDYLPGSCRHLTLDQHSVPTRSLPGRYRRPIICVSSPDCKDLMEIEQMRLVTKTEECLIDLHTTHLLLRSSNSILKGTQPGHYQPLHLRNNLSFIYTSIILSRASIIVTFFINLF
ncbi:hypothetical protein AMECASPLE_014456, partial [Ameca splendens]